MIPVRDSTELHKSGIPLEIFGQEPSDMEGEECMLMNAAETTTLGGATEQHAEAEDVRQDDGEREDFDLFHVSVLLYCSHFLSRWGDRMWEFAVALFMVKLWPDSLFLAALYGLTESAAMAAFGVLVGSWVDAQPRLKVVKVSLLVQNSCVAAAAMTIVFLLHNPRPSHTTLAQSNAHPDSSPVFIALVILINLLGGVAALAGLAGNIAVERDWVVVLAQGQPSWVLPQLNATLRRIDLCCKLLAPIAVGVLMSLTSTAAAAIAIASWNVLSFGAELSLLLHVHSSVPALALPRNSSCAPESESCGDEDVGGAAEEGTAHLLAETENREQMHGNGGEVGVGKGVGLVPRSVAGCVEGVLHAARAASTVAHELREGWRVYAMQEGFLAALALACLYLTVISFGTLMTAWLDWHGVSTVVLGAARALAAAVGICATLLFPFLQSRFTTVRTGLWAIWMQWTMLLACVAAVFVHNTSTASALLIAGVIASRLGLWMFDLSVTQLMQESVPESERGVVGGVQSSMQELMELASFACGIILPRPQDFGLLVLLSFAMISLAAFLYSRYSFNTRGHLWHLEKLRPLLLSARCIRA